MVKNDSNPKNQPFLFIIHSNVLENAINPKQVLSPLPTIVSVSIVQILLDSRHSCYNAMTFYGPLFSHITLEFPGVKNNIVSNFYSSM